MCKVASTDFLEHVSVVSIIVFHHDCATYLTNTNVFYQCCLVMFNCIGYIVKTLSLGNYNTFSGDK